MRNFEFIHMPDYFTRFLKLNMQAGNKNFSLFKSEIYNNKSLYAIFKKCFSDVDANLDVDVVVNSLGWEGFRNRMAATFIQYNNSGIFEVGVNESLCAEILHFEKNLQTFSVPGFSRGFLLGFYLKLWSQELGKRQESVRTTELLNITDKVLEVLQKSRSKVIEIDWIVVILSSLLKFLNKDIVFSLFTQDTDFHELYEILDEEQKKYFIKNLLNYGSSINDQEIFLPS